MTRVYRLRYSPFPQEDRYPQYLSWLRPTLRLRFRADFEGRGIPCALGSRAPGEMLPAGLPYQRCQRLFVRYPLAVRTANRTGTVRSMVLTVLDGDDAGFYVLLHDRGTNEDFYLLKRWRGRRIGPVCARSGTDVPVAFKNVVTNGVPVPRNGSLFGWKTGDVITSLITIHNKYTPAHPEPSWSLLLLADVPETLWPPFVLEPLFGAWFWDHYRAGSIVWLDNLVAATTDVVFWVDTGAILDSDCCIVARDIESSKGYTLRRGRYVYCQVLQEGKQVPSLAELLASPDKTDLASRFQPSSRGPAGPLWFAHCCSMGDPQRVGLCSSHTRFQKSSERAGPSSNNTSPPSMHIRIRRPWYVPTGFATNGNRRCGALAPG